MTHDDSKTRLESFPKENGQQLSSPIPPADDLSAGASPDIPQLIKEDILDRQRIRTYRHVAFYGTVTLIGLTFFALFAWLSWIGFHVASPNVVSTYRVSLFVVPVVVLATLAALLILALLKFVFRAQEQDKNDDPTPISLLQGLGTKVVELARDYLAKKI